MAESSSKGFDSGKASKSDLAALKESREEDDSINKFQNDGSFLEMFKKRLQEQQETKESTTATVSDHKKEESSSSKSKFDATYFSPQTITYKEDNEGTVPSSKKPRYQVLF